MVSPSRPSGPWLPAGVPLVQAVPEPDLALSVLPAQVHLALAEPRGKVDQPHLEVLGNAAKPQDLADLLLDLRRGGGQPDLVASPELLVETRPSCQHDGPLGLLEHAPHSSGLRVTRHQPAHGGLEPRDELLGLLGREEPLRLLRHRALYPRTIRRVPPRTRREPPGARGRRG